MDHTVKICPYCTGDTEVYNSRMTKNGLIKRYRRCKNCQRLFQTLEVLLFDAPEDLRDAE